MTRWALYMLSLLAVCGTVAWGCYATTGPVPSCAADPSQDGCYPPIHDAALKDAGR